MKFGKKTRVFSALFALLLVLSLFGCGAKSGNDSVMNSAVSDAYYDKSESYDTVYGRAYDSESPTESAPSASSSVPGSAKIIYTADLEMQTQDFDAADAALTALVGELGGYFENRSVNSPSSGYRYASYTVRVPAAQFETFCRQAGELCHVTYETSNARDISETYYDTESRLKTAQIKLERLQELLAKADNMEDIITLESAISETEWTIESLSGTLRGYDALVDYATVTLSLREVYKLSDTEQAPQTFGEKLASAFRGGIENAGEALEDFALWLAWNWTGLLVFAAVAVGLVLLVRRALRRLLPRKSPAPPTETEEEKK